ncbi:hypothetical protein [Bacillus sp. XF8]|uniref:GNAT family N-acetyltransferase n=1 Tax=Bacillus bingmayongensis TaxID=1150157 RepID=A0ABU5JWY3_9BACI|nr:hypothetical protein [Bacillus sp. XF8]MBO1581494.1 hypothetical protein [Bacillus sp. XF8]MDZ5607949.1 hypothetical protein [Bacillus pseudomycoides]
MRKSLLQIETERLIIRLFQEDDYNSWGEGAYYIYNWIIDTHHEVSGKFIDPSLGELDW